ETEIIPDRRGRAARFHHGRSAGERDPHPARFGRGADEGTGIRSGRRRRHRHPGDGGGRGVRDRPGGRRHLHGRRRLRRGLQRPGPGALGRRGRGDGGRPRAGRRADAGHREHEQRRGRADGADGHVFHGPMPVRRPHLPEAPV
ncbi:MAG: hypothetical protein AVDCRST_MAG89-5410, partial [uncultured Gemmatimonadetes bacterium]